MWEVINICKTFKEGVLEFSRRKVCEGLISILVRVYLCLRSWGLYCWKLRALTALCLFSLMFCNLPLSEVGLQAGWSNTERPSVPCDGVCTVRSSKRFLSIILPEHYGSFLVNYFPGFNNNVPFLWHVAKCLWILE